MNKHSASKWIRTFLCSLLAVLLFLSAVAYAVDPFMQFRVKDNAYMLDEWDVCGGLIKNYDYDTLIIGSSMAQCFDMDVVRQELGVKPLHIALGGINPTEIGKLLDVAYRTEKADTYYICVDMMTFNKDNEESRLSEHLLKDDFISKLRYLLSYEVWFGFIPVDIAFVALDAIGVELPIKYAYQKSIDKLGDWRLEHPVGGEQMVLDNYKSSQYSVSYVDSENLYQNIVSSIDTFFARCQFDKGEHVFFFPPYSSLCWAEYQNRGQFEIYLQAKRYFIEKALEYGVTVYDFQSADITMDLNNYKDTTHFMPHINDWMVTCFASGEWTVNRDNMVLFEEKLVENTNNFREKYAEIFSE